MSNLIFHAESGNGSVSFADTVAINVASGELSAGGPVMASHSEGVWRIGDVALTRITCAGPVYLEICDTSGQQRFGPFSDLVVGANTIWSAAGAFARYSAFSKTWLLTKEGAEPLAISQAVGLVPALAAQG